MEYILTASDQQQVTACQMDKMSPTTPFVSKQMSAIEHTVV